MTLKNLETTSEPASKPRRSWWPALAGVVSLGLGLGVAELIAGLLGRTATPVVAVGEAFIDIVPSWLKELAIDLFGTNDKTALIVGMLVVLAILAAGIGMLAARNRYAGMAAAGALLAIAAVAATTRPDSTSVDFFPTAIGGVAALIALAWLTPRSVVNAGGPLAETSRRAFLVGAAAVAGLGAVAGGIGRLMGGRRTDVEASRTDLANDINFAYPTVPSGSDLEIGDAEPWRTPNGDFYLIDTSLSAPLVKAEDWSLRIHGMVETAIEIDYLDLVDMGLVERWITLNCVSNQVGGDLIGNAHWTGVPIRDVLALARPRPEADAVKSTSEDGWTAGTPLDVLTDDSRDALLAVGMNGEPLPVEHGFPVRMIVPGLYGYVSATKWVVDLEVTRFADFNAYWTDRGWSEQGPVKVSARIDVPGGGDSVPAGKVTVAGVAWAQHRGIERVELRVDDGPWSEARLADAPTDDTWRQWVWEWDAADTGRHDLQVRATTRDGEVQTGERAGTVPDGATGWHKVGVDVR